MFLILIEKEKNTNVYHQYFLTYCTSFISPIKANDRTIPVNPGNNGMNISYNQYMCFCAFIIKFKSSSCGKILPYNLI